MKSSLLKTVLATQLELYSSDSLNYQKLGELNLNKDKDPNGVSTRPSEESFLVELDNELFNELLDLEKKYPQTIHVIDNNTIIITPLPGNVSYNIPIVKSCRYLPAHVIFLVSDIMPFDIQVAFLEHIKCLSIGTYDTPLGCSTGIFNKYTRNFNDLPTDIPGFDSGFVRLPSMFNYTSNIISGIVGNSDHFVTGLRSTARDWNSIGLRLSPTEFFNPRNEFTVVIDGRRVLNSITTILTLPTAALALNEVVITLNVIITRPSDLFTLNELVFDYPFDYSVPKGIIVNYFMFDFTVKSITKSNSTQSILYVRKASSISSTKNYLESEFKDVVKFNIYTSGSYPLVIRDASSLSKATATALSFKSYDRYRTGDTLYNVSVPVADACPLVNVPDDYSEDSKHANFIFKRVIKKPLQE